jgi:hypothetical protein
MPVRWTFPPAALANADGPTISPTALGDATPLPIGQIPPLWEVGMRIRVHAHGWASSTSVTPTMTVALYLAKPATAIASALLLCTSPALALPVLTQTGWLLDYWGRVTAVSTPASATAGQISGRGRYLPPGASLSVFGADQEVPPTYAGRLSAGFDTTSPQNLLIGITLSSATGTPTAACEDLSYELIG